MTVWDLETGEELQTLQGRSSGAAQHLTYSADGTMLAAILGGDHTKIRRGWIGENGEVAVWDAETGRKLYTLRGHRKRFARLAFSHNGRRLATASNSGGAVKIWDAASGNELLTLKDWGQSTTHYLAFSPDDTRLYAVGPISPGPVSAIEIKIWDATPRPEVKQP